MLNVSAKIQTSFERLFTHTWQPLCLGREALAPAAAWRDDRQWQVPSKARPSSGTVAAAVLDAFNSLGAEPDRADHRQLRAGRRAATLAVVARVRLHPTLHCRRVHGYTDNSANPCFEPATGHHPLDGESAWHGACSTNLVISWVLACI